MLGGILDVHFLDLSLFEDFTDRFGLADTSLLKRSEVTAATTWSCRRLANSAECCAALSTSRSIPRGKSDHEGRTLFLFSSQVTHPDENMWMERMQRLYATASPKQEK